VRLHAAARWAADGHWNTTLGDNLTMRWTRPRSLSMAASVLSAGDDVECGCPSWEAEKGME
jgi:hypothetical protein